MNGYVIPPKLMMAGRRIGFRIRIHGNDMVMFPGYFLQSIPFLKTGIGPLLSGYYTFFVHYGKKNIF
jgi:hypothetical protein